LNYFAVQSEKPRHSLHR